MSGFAGPSTHISPSAGRQPRAVDPSDERRIRRNARDSPRTSIPHVGDTSLPGRSTPRRPDIDKDLPRIPSTSSGPRHTKPMTMSSEVTTSAVTSPTLGLPTLPISPNLKRTAVTEAQKIASRYLRRHGSLEALRNEIVYPPMREVSFCLISDTLPRFPQGRWVLVSASC
jgi:hypothetical protein